MKKIVNTMNSAKFGTNDRLSDDQKQFLTDIKKSGGVALIAKQSYTGAVVLEGWEY